MYQKEYLVNDLKFIAYFNNLYINNKYNGLAVFLKIYIRTSVQMTIII